MIAKHVWVLVVSSNGIGLRPCGFGFSPNALSASWAQ